MKLGIVRSLFLVVMACHLTVIQADPPSMHDHHVLFDNSSARSFYYHSQASVVAPSSFEIVNTKVPVSFSHAVSPPNALKLHWTSASGGDWRTTILALNRYGHRFTFEGDSLVLWCYSEEGLNANSAPRIGVQDSKGVSLPDIPLLFGSESLPAGKWVKRVLPFSQFAAPFGGTDELTFDKSRLAHVMLAQGLDDGIEHTLFLDDIGTLDQGASDMAAPDAPKALRVEGRDSHFDITWSPSEAPDLLGYRIYRSWDGTDFTPIATRSGRFHRAVDHVGRVDKTAYYKVSAVDIYNQESALSIAAMGSTRSLDDDALFDMVQRACFQYYWEGANPDSGMATEILPGDANLVAVGASGFGIMALVTATERHFITRDEAVERVLKIVRFLKSADRFHGVWPHFLDGRTGHIWPFFGKFDNGGDLVETAFLIQGLLTARHYFTQDNSAEREIRDTITKLWKEVEWDWYRQTLDSDFLYWHWSPDHAWHINHPLVGWNETMIVYLLAMSSPTHGVPASMYYSGWAGQSDRAIRYRQNWSRTTQGDHYINGNNYYGIKLDVGEGTGAELFFTQFSFLGFDPRGKRDRFTNYFRNNRNIALINRAYCSENPSGFVGYGPNCWGRSAGIFSGGGRAQPRDDNGTICCSAALGSFPYTPEESLVALKHFYRDLGTQTFGVYGFHDGFNLTEGWCDEVYMGLNQAQIVVMIENYRSGLIWRTFMSNPEIEGMLQAVGFTSDKDF